MKSDQFIISTVILAQSCFSYRSAYVTDRRIQETHIQQDLADQIERDAYELEYL